MRPHAKLTGVITPRTLIRRVRLTPLHAVKQVTKNQDQASDGSAPSGSGTLPVSGTPLITSAMLTDILNNITTPAIPKDKSTSKAVNPRKKRKKPCADISSDEGGRVKTGRLVQLLQQPAEFVRPVPRFLVVRMR